MLRSNKDKEVSYEMVRIEDLVLQDHLLRKIGKYIDFSFITEKVRPYYYENNGRPSIDPVVLFKMMFIGYLFGVRSERLEREIQTTYRWFLGLNLGDKVPDHTTISWNRRTRFADTTVFQDIFDEIVLLAMNHRMVGGRVLMTDFTHLKANANKKKFTKEIVEVSTRAYEEELNQAMKKIEKPREKAKTKRGR